MFICETQRLHVRRLCSDDAAFLVQLLNDPSFLQNIGDRGVRSPDDARGYVAKSAVASYDKHGFGLFHVSLKFTGESIGLCGLLKRDWLDDVDIGFAYLPQFWGKGYAYEAAAGVIEWGRTVRGITRVVGFVRPGNAGSIGVLRKLGMQDRGLIRSPEGQESQLFAP